MKDEKVQERKITTQEQIDAMRKEISRAKKKELNRKRQRKTDAFSVLTGKLVINIAGWVVFFVIVAFLLFSLITVQRVKNKGEIPDIFGFQLYLIKSGSMEPTFPVGTIILTRRPKDASKLEKGDIVTFKDGSGAIVTHRIIKVVKGTDGIIRYETKGDNPISSPDLKLLEPENIIAVFLAKIPHT